jgi:acid phosphatase
MVKPGKYGEYVNHYRLLRTLEDMYGVGHLGSSAVVSPITDVWK